MANEIFTGPVKDALWAVISPLALILPDEVIWVVDFKPAAVKIPVVASSASFLINASSTFSVTELPKVTEPPPPKLVPAVIVTASSASFAIGISSLSISETMVAAMVSFINDFICAEDETNVLAVIT